MLMFLKFGLPRIAGQMVGFFQRLPLPVLTLIIGVCAGGGFIGYLWWNQPSCEQEVAMEALAAERASAQAREDIIISLLSRNQELENEIRVLSTEVVEVVPDNPVCDYSRAAIGVLNKARTGLSDASRNSPDSATTASTITQQAATEYWIEDAAQFRKCREQLLQLREWYERVKDTTQ